MTRNAAVLAVLVLLVLGIFACTPPAGADDTPTLSLGTVKPIAPDLTLELGLSASWLAWTPPADWVVIGGRPIWIDALYIDEHGFFGASVECFDKTRVGITAFRIGADSGTDWSVYLATPLASW